MKVCRIIDPRPQARPVKPVAEPSASLTAALAAPVAVRSKRKQKSAPAPAATLAFEFDAQDAEPIRIFVRDADKFGVSVFLLDRSHRGHVPEPTTLAKPPSSSPKGSSSSAPSRRGAAAPEPVADNFSLLVDHPALGPVAIGTYNPGNFCYANSMLVALAHARRLVELLAQAPLPRPSADVARAAVQALKLLVSEDEAVDLGNFFAAALLGPNRLQPDFALQQQEDGFEFAASLLQRLDESSIGSIVREQFGLRLKQKIQCTGCARRTEQSLTVLSLEVAIRAAQLPAEYKTVVPLSHLVDAHFAPEYVESNCHGAVKVLRKHSFVVQEYPPFLLLAIKRFRYSNLLNRATKLDFRVQVPQTLPVETLATDCWRSQCTTAKTLTRVITQRLARTASAASGLCTITTSILSEFTSIRSPAPRVFKRTLTFCFCLWSLLLLLLLLMMRTRVKPSDRPSV